MPKRKRIHECVIPELEPQLPTLCNRKAETYECRNRDYNIVIIPAGSPQLFFGWYGVICFDGNLRIDGYDLEPSGFDGNPNSMHFVCAPACMGKPAVFESRGLETLAAKEKRLRLRLKEVTDEFNIIVNKWMNKIACVLLIHKKVPVVVDIFKQLHERKLYFKQNEWNSKGINMLDSPGWNIYPLATMQNIDKKLLDIEIRRGEGNKLVALVYGPKGTGKSSFVRYLANRLLSSTLPLYILDVDLGQTEYTPAGCMSLWKVAKPLLDTPWCHQATNFECSYFYGDISPADDMSKYKNIFIHLLNKYREKSQPGSVLIINSMGWVEGAGLNALQYIIDWSNPNYCFQTCALPSLTLPKTTEVISIQKDVPLFNRSTVFSKYRPLSLKPPLLRELATIGYFAELLNRPLFATLQQGRKFIIKFEDATFGIPEDLAAVDDRYFLSSLNVQLVALCSSTEPVGTRRILNRDYLPEVFVIDMVTPLLQCHGFGIINAIDLEQQQIIIISPISAEEMAKVTIIARGNRMFVPPIMCKTANGAPTMYMAGAAQILKGADPDLYGSLRIDKHAKFHRAHFPIQD